MRILLVTSFKYPHKGGLSTHLKDLESGLKKFGHHVEIIQYDDYINKKGYMLNVLFRRKDKLINRIEYKRKRIEKLVNRKLKVDKFDLVHFHDSISGSIELPKTMKRVFTMHGPLTGHSNENGELDFKTNNYLESIERHSYFLNEMIAVDQGQKRIINSLYPDNEVKVINNSVNITMTKPVDANQRGNYFLMTRRLTEKNGVLLAVKAFIEWENNELELLIAGDGPQKPHILDYLKDKPNKNKVKLLGSLENNEVIKLVRNAKATIVPSIPVGNVIEATSISALESLAVGTPVLASNIGGLVEIDKGKEVIHYINPNERESTINKYEYVLNNIHNNDYLKYQNHLFKYFSYGSWLDKHLQFYNTLVPNSDS